MVLGDILGKEASVGFEGLLQYPYYINEMEKLLETIPVWV